MVKWALVLTVLIAAFFRVQPSTKAAGKDPTAFDVMLIASLLCPDGVCAEEIECPFVTAASADGNTMSYGTLHVRMLDLPVRELIVDDRYQDVEYVDLNADGTLDATHSINDPTVFFVIGGPGKLSALFQSAYAADVNIVGSCVRERKGLRPI